MHQKMSSNHYKPINKLINIRDVILFAKKKVAFVGKKTAQTKKTVCVFIKEKEFFFFWKSVILAD